MAKIYEIEIVGKKYPLVFSATATEKLKGYFGAADVNAAASGIGVKDINAVLEILMDAGRLYCNLTGVEVPEPLPCAPADVLDIEELTEIVILIKNAIIGGQEREVEVADPKNAEVTQEK